MWNYLGLIPLAIWIYFLVGRGGFWRIPAPVRLTRAQLAPRRVVAIIPARNEADVIGLSIRSLLQQNVPLIVVDDGSTDGTAEVAGRFGDAVTTIRGEPVPRGWTGKLWALSQGVSHAAALAPDYLLFTDADIRHGPNSIAELVSIAENRNCELASYMVKLACDTVAEKALIPAFVYFFVMLYPPRWIESTWFRTAGAAGGCILIRPRTLARIGGLSAIRSEIIDDCALARAVKRSGGRIWMSLTPDTVSTRSYGSFAEIGRMISRTAFNQLHHSLWLLIGTLFAIFVTFLLAPLLLLSGRMLPALLGLGAWLLMSISYVPMLRLYQRSPLWSIALPGIAIFYAGATIHSAVQYWRRRGGEWKGRVQDTRDSGSRA